ncbi:response regulator [Sporosarcina sp. ACRSL]|uniref:response regulator n=1 Tax=Sporosarcina sp. ACRSL TaxID=2918215 RepID=UPI001EF63007|nr:response regulator [Sporosarcina sp. ACRSL]MCG7344973.1 response regulator [Sporosarcina sp. ACRSL]
MRYFIVDDDLASRRMLEQIINEDELGYVVGEAENGVQAIAPIQSTQPDVVLIDLLMPALDGIETLEQLKKQGFQGQFIMISQIVNKEMVGEAYEKGVEFFIHKPINRVEVRSILMKTKEKYQLQQSLRTIRDSLANIDATTEQPRRKRVSDIVRFILNDMGIIGEVGSDDIVAIIEILMSREERIPQLPPLKDLYEAVARKMENVNVSKESKAIEQRIRRTIVAAVNNIASMGVVDYTSPQFEYYAPRYFDFQDIRLRMKQIDEDKETTARVKINIKKFIQVLYLETEEKYTGKSTF